MNFVPTTLNQAIVVNDVYTVHYFEFSKDYTFEGESHPFWEFVYVDKGEILALSEGEEIHLKKGQILFHKPNEFHTLMANGVTAPNILIVSFNCDNEDIRFFENRVAHIDDHERRLLATIIAESENAFSTPLDDPCTTHLERNKNASPYSEQFIKISLEWLLLSIIRNNTKKQPSPIIPLIKENSQNEIFENVVKYLEANVDKHLALSKICQDNLVSKSYLQTLFREKTGGGVIDYFNHLKINTAKRMIRESSGNFIEISFKLGYTSIHYFSRQFKSMTGMTLTEYASSVKILTGKK